MSNDKELAEIIGYLLEKIDTLSGKVDNLSADVRSLNLLQMNAEQRLDFIEENLSTIIDSVMYIKEKTNETQTDKR